MTTEDAQVSAPSTAVLPVAGTTVLPTAHMATEDAQVSATNPVIENTQVLPPDTIVLLAANVATEDSQVPVTGTLLTTGKGKNSWRLPSNKTGRYVFFLGIIGNCIDGSVLASSHQNTLRASLAQAPQTEWVKRGI